jgi:RNA 2',3'-cyclic 3'-phosphodiesterase
VAEAKERLFIGVPLPESLKRYVRAAQEALPKMSGLRLLPEDQWHVTLAFLGEVDRTTAQLARRIVEVVPPEMGGECGLGGFLMLPSEDKTRVVTLAIQDDGGPFAKLYEVLMTSLETAGVMEREDRPFRPHLTVARLRIPGRVRPRSEVGQVRFAVESVCLYRSELKREGASYTVLTRRVFNKRRRSKG